MKRVLLQTILPVFFLVIISSIVNAEYTLQLATYPYKSNAERHLKALAEQDYSAFIHVQERDSDRFWYKVRLGPFPTMEAALEHKRTMQSNGYRGDLLLVESNALGAANSNSRADQFEETLLSESKATQQPSSPPSEENRKEITLEWDPNTEPDLAGYKIHYDTDPNPPYNPDESDLVDEGPSPITVGRDTTRITLHGLTKNKEYYFSISAENRAGTQSDKSAAMASDSADRPSANNQMDGPSAETTIGSKDRKMPLSDEVEISPRNRETDSVATKPRRQPPYTKPFSPEDATDTTILSAGDTLYIEIPGQRQMSQNYDIGPDGNLYMLALGKIPAHGLAISDLNRVLMKKGKKYITKGEQPLIQLVDIKRYVYIRGGVRYAGWYRVSPWEKVDDLIDMADGLLSPDVYSGIKLLRPTSDGMLQLDTKTDIMLQSNDILDVPFPKQYLKKIDSGDLLFVSIPRKSAKTREQAYGTESSDFNRELRQNQIAVDSNGYLYIPSLGHLYVRNLTTEQIENLVETRLPKYLARAEKVVISIVEKKHFVQVYGHVHKPGRLNIQETGTVQEALSLAGNAIDGAIMSDIMIHRRKADRLNRIKVNMYQYTITGDERLLTPLQEDDTLFVPISSNFGNVKRTLEDWEPPTERLEQDVKAKVRIFGAVHNVGIYEPQEDMDLIDLLILASGQDEDADLSKVLIIRNGKVELSFNMEEWLEKFAEGGVNPVPKLRNGDTVYVTYVKKKEHEPKEDELFYTLGEVRDEGQHKLFDRMTVLQALALAGGLEEFADAERILIIRWVEGRQENLPFNYHKAIQGKLPELNMYIQARDVIWVP